MDPVRHALRYPFRSFRDSCLLTPGGRAPMPAQMQADLVRETRLGGRTPVLAVGANAAPAVLAGKLAGHVGLGGVPVLSVEARDLVAVYSAHFTRYGALPATPVPCPGARSRLFVLVLDATQLAALDATEAIGVNYRRVRLGGRMRLDLVLDNGMTMRACDAYVSLHGPLWPDRGPVALAAVPARGVPWPRMSQARVQDRVRRRLGVGGTLAAFVRGNVADPGLRARRTAALKATG